ncbi:MAG: hypothetical protein AAF226_06465, partial [Verrucomicrobiota bacterium]
MRFLFAIFILIHSFASGEESYLFGVEKWGATAGNGFLYEIDNDSVIISPLADYKLKSKGVVLSVPISEKQRGALME